MNRIHQIYIIKVRITYYVTGEEEEEEGCSTYHDHQSGINVVFEPMLPSSVAGRSVPNNNGNKHV